MLEEVEILRDGVSFGGKIRKAGEIVNLIRVPENYRAKVRAGELADVRLIGSEGPSYADTAAHADETETVPQNAAQHATAGAVTDADQQAHAIVAMSASEAASAIREVDDAAVLEAVIRQERATKNRVTVIDAAEQRASQLE